MPELAVRTLLRRAVDRLRRAVGDVAMRAGERPDVRILRGVKLYREVRAGGLVYRGEADTPGRTIDYVFDQLPPEAVAGKALLDLGSAGGAVCFEGVRRGARAATGVEREDRRIRGARFIKRRAGVDAVRFVHQDFFSFFEQARPQVDVVFALNVLHHFDHPQPLLRRMVAAARERLVIEVPTRFETALYGDYAPAHLVSAEPPLTSADDMVRWLASYDFAVEVACASPEDTRFCGADEAPRTLFVLRRAESGVVKPLEVRRAEVAWWRDRRQEAWEASRRDGQASRLEPGETFGDWLTRVVGASWSTGAVNVVVCGPPASGKSHLLEGVPPAARPPYHDKIFKFPNHQGEQGLRRHLAGPSGAGGRVAQALVHTVDGPGSHVSADGLAEAVAGKAVVVIVLNVDFDEHLRRLHARQVARVGTPDETVDYDVPLQFDARVVVNALTARGAQYRVLTT